MPSSTRVTGDYIGHRRVDSIDWEKKPLKKINFGLSPLISQFVTDKGHSAWEVLTFLGSNCLQKPLVFQYLGKPMLQKPSVFSCFWKLRWCFFATNFKLSWPLHGSVRDDSPFSFRSDDNRATSLIPQEYECFLRRVHVRVCHGNVGFQMIPM